MSGKSNWRKFATPIALVLLAIILAILTNGIFISPRNLTNLCRQVTVIGILALGMTMIILTGGIDLSVGSVVAVTGVMVALLQVKGIAFLGIGPMGTAGAIVVTLLVGAVIGLWNGFWISKFNIAPFVITLGMMTIARGLALLFSNGVAISNLPEGFTDFGSNYISPVSSLVILAGCFLGGLTWLIRAFKLKRFKSTASFAIRLTFLLIIIGLCFYVFNGYHDIHLLSAMGYKGIPLPVALFALLAAAGIIVLQTTAFGRHIYAIGGNENAARLSGIKVAKVKLLVYTIMSLMAAVAGIVLTSRLAGAAPTAGQMFELDAIASVVIGGTSLTGGVGGIPGTLMGAFLIGMLDNGMSLLNVPEFYQLVVKGLIIILAVWVDVQGKARQS